MDNLLQTIRELKTKAKNRRDLKRYESAETILNRAITLTEEELSATDSSDWKAALASELSDCYGLLGGVYRRWGLEAKVGEQRTLHLEQSVDAYTKGYNLEVVEEYHIVNSYNMVNRLVSYILLVPDSLRDPTAQTDPALSNSLNVWEELAKAEAAIRDQLKEKRRGDIWALADFALVRLLQNKDYPGQAYAEFNAQSPPDYAYESALSTLRPLAELNFPAASKCREVVQLLESKLSQLQGSGRAQ
jgi:hypothetical protein